jgi:proline iminopeptidase
MKGADRLEDIPITLVNGRYDVICPPITAYRLHKKLPRSKLVIVEKAGHSPGGGPLETAMIEAVKTFE